MATGKIHPGRPNVAGKKRDGAEGPKRSVYGPKRAKLAQQPPGARLTSPARKPKSRLTAKTQDPVIVAQAWKVISQVINSLPGEGSKQENKNMLKSARRNLAKSKAQAAADRLGTPRSQSTVIRSRRNR